MGMSNAASISMKMALKFRPKILLMTGICAGIKDKPIKVILLFQNMFLIIKKVILKIISLYLRLNLEI